MLKKTLHYIVVFLGILIIFAFFALIYGMYLKISTNSENIFGAIYNIRQKEITEFIEK